MSLLEKSITCDQVLGLSNWFLFLKAVVCDPILSQPLLYQLSYRTKIGVQI